MRQKHLLKTNRLLLIVHSITFFFGTVGLVTQLSLAVDMPKANSLIPLILNILVFLGGFFVYGKGKYTDNYAWYVGCGYTLVYAFMLLMSTSALAYPYLIPIIMVLVMLMNKKRVVVVSVAYIIINVIRCVITVATAADPSTASESVMLEMIVSVLVVIASLTGVKLLTEFFENSINEVNDALEKSTEATGTLHKIAEHVDTETASAVEDIENTRKLSETSYQTMNAIADGVQTIVDAIADQKSQTENIQGAIDDTHKRTEEIVALMKEMEKSLGEGIEGVDKLLDTVKNGIEATHDMELAAKALTDKTQSVRGVVDVIVSISSKTNLLALNASIEAARAGEAGRGFAVVADEIRVLSEQTRTETENISAILNELVEYAGNVSEKVQENVALSDTENELASGAREQFDSIQSQTGILATNIAEMGSKVNSLRDANEKIVDSVSTLSSSSEEINASVDSAVNASAENVELVGKVGKVIEDIAKNVKELNK